ncbi:hypothetical protein B0T19DRAFT_189622 [Cercophora scortea]|uniref:Calpain catalytic domain-containing protein n=1 Tax=Cercophora scortea TaxID=314031 RepID=A0AAE0MER1_9PEZI|nr:hypothetical protein B0T19DRAFT_189622 [Cercophora scortea]
MSGSSSSSSSSRSVTTRDGPIERRIIVETVNMAPPHGNGARDGLKPQQRVDEFWRRFMTNAPGKATTVLPKNELAEKLAKRKAAKESVIGGGETTTPQASFDEAAALCRARVEGIVRECRRVNQKYRDPHFDLEFDLKTGRRDCLESLCNTKSIDDSDTDSDCSYRPRPPRPFNARRRRRGGRGRGRGAPHYDLPSRDAGGDGGGDGGGGGGGQGEPSTAVNGEGFQMDPPSSPHGRVPGSKFVPRSVKRVTEIFDEPKFYIDGPTANDVRQGRDGDCWLMAALCTLSNKPGLIEKICVAHDKDVGVYGFVFHRDGGWVSEIIDDKLYLTKPDYDEAIADGINIERILWEDRERPDSEESYRRIYQSNSGALYFAQCEHPNETWLPLLEKAYAKAHGDYAAIEGGFTGEGIEDLTGGVTSGLFTTDILDKEYFWKEELMKVNQQFLFGCSTGLWGRGFGNRKGILEGHAYSVMRAVEMEGERLLLLKNPWGKGEWHGPWSDGSKEWTPEWLQRLNHRFGDDGAFWISYKDLLRKYQAFDRTRLFGPEWKVTSAWTTLSVPWTLEYHDTKFAITLAKPGPVVIVLSQLDDRYFRGLEGQYKFGLGLRVHKAGEDDYLVRNQSTHRMTRSINVELDLEAGEYHVLIKLDARRLDWITPVEDVVRENAHDRREKLIRIGLAYDLAHSKAKIIETPEEKAAYEAYEKRKKEQHREHVRKIRMEIKEREYYNNVKGLKKQRKMVQQRKERQKAKAERRKAKAEKKAAERKEREEKRAAEEEEEEAKKKKKAGDQAQTTDPPVAGDNKTGDGEAKDNNTETKTSEKGASVSTDDDDTPPLSESNNSTSEAAAPIIPETASASAPGEKETQEKVNSPSNPTPSAGEKSLEAPSSTKNGENPTTAAATTPEQPTATTTIPTITKNEPNNPNPSPPPPPGPAHEDPSSVEYKLRRAISVVAGVKEELESLLLLNDPPQNHTSTTDPEPRRNSPPPPPPSQQHLLRPPPHDPNNNSTSNFPPPNRTDNDNDNDNDYFRPHSHSRSRSRARPHHPPTHHRPFAYPPAPARSPRPSPPPPKTTTCTA